VTLLPLPPLLVLTDRAGTNGRPLLDVALDAVRGGARAIVLREKDLPRLEREQLARALRAMLGPVGGLLLVASDASVRGEGVHLAAEDPMPDLRPPFVGRSCHDRAELRRSAEEGCDYATLSPVFATASKPGYGPALAPGALRDTPLPVFALGGVSAANARQCMSAGASGVAVMGAVMGAASPADAVADLLAAIGAGA
jgi:thiamine-phosphate diphosphorylase